ncbi:heat shock protein 90-6, mitochondrial-like [Arachis duranensis]|uniref:Heat shock protein 90-6, mitochondrial-like n=1 Tax=Arachis duranensis TaxID=130453 RepID=A0A6P5MPW1_ARADU|nr:heat shock protein 90-6, mitochondrial-like [Arachis duranensis]
MIQTVLKHEVATQAQGPGSWWWKANEEGSAWMFFDQQVKQAKNFQEAGNHKVRIMRKRLVRKAFDMILGICMSHNRELYVLLCMQDYEKFWENFGKHLKLGCIKDRENHKRIAPLLRFFSSQSEEELISLDEYVENMKPDQKDIYYIAADSVNSAKNTPFLERLAEKDLEVLFPVDPINEVAIQNLKSYKEKNFVYISKEDLDLCDKNEEREKDMKQEFGQTCDWIKKHLGIKLQPDNPSQLGGKIYDMMGMALTGKWFAYSGQSYPTRTQPHVPEIVEAELVDPAEASSQK